MGILLRVPRWGGSPRPEFRLALPSGVPLTSSRSGASRLQFPSGLGAVSQTARGRGVGALRSAPCGPRVPSDAPSLRPSFQGAGPGPGHSPQFPLREVPSARGAGTARLPPQPLRPRPAPPPLPPPSPGVGGAGSGSPSTPAPAASGALEKAVRAGARHAGPELPAAATASEPPDHP